MQDGYLINLTDDEGNGFELEVVGEVEYEDNTYVVFLPAYMDENDPDYGFVILRSVEENGEEAFSSVDDEELLEKVYAIYMEMLMNEDGEDAPEDGDPQEDTEELFDFQGFKED